MQDTNDEQDQPTSSTQPTIPPESTTVTTPPEAPVEPNPTVAEQAPAAPVVHPAFQATTASVPPTAPKKSRTKLLIIVIGLILVGAASAGTYFVLQSKKDDTKQTTAQSATAPTPKKDLTPDEAFKEMLKNSHSIKTYSIKVTHASSSKSGQNTEYNVTYNYNADVDVSAVNTIKLKGTFDLNKPGKQAKGQTVWIGETLSTHLTEALVTDYGDIDCMTPGNKTAVSPSLAALKAGFVKTKRSDFTLNCGAAAYHDFIGLIKETNTPFSDFPLFNAASLTDIEQRAATASQDNLYKIYDGTIVDLEGKPTYRYNVLVENYQVTELSKVLAIAAGYAQDDSHIISSGDSNYGFSSPGRYLTVWIDKATNQLRRVESKVDTNDVDIKFNTVIDYSNINGPVTIVAP